MKNEAEPRPLYEAEAHKTAGKLQGKTALITGDDFGIGRAVASLYAREGARVAITYRPRMAFLFVLQQDQPWSDCGDRCKADTRAEFWRGENQ
jgi:NAD(P)-dependent dehydrogenase (short-subunit alcohol dehydrogenase family)